MAGIAYRPEIDGLRAVAVVPVILFHMGFGWVRGGFLGVDVFFVISGFLITSIILRELENGTFSFREFWARRVRRIFPALMTMLLTTSIVAALVLFRGDTTTTGIEGASAALSFANIALWKLAGSYWGPGANASPFLHTWSLSVEEQFYLFYPLFLFLLFRFARSWVRVALATLVMASFGLYLFGSSSFPEATFYLLPTRAWELGCGCLIAASAGHRERQAPGRASSVVAAIGLVAVIVSFFVFTDERNFPGYMAIPVVGAALVIAFSAGGDSVVRRLLSTSPCVLTGKASYSLYLWHWPILVIWKDLDATVGGLPRYRYSLILIVVVSVLSYLLIEKPTRKRSRNSSVIRLSFSLMLASLVASLYLHARSPYYDTSMFDPVVWKGAAYNVFPATNWGRDGTALTRGVILPPVPDPRADAYATGGIIKVHGGSIPELVVLGDSHAVMWSGMVDGVAEELGITAGFFGANAVYPFLKLPLGEMGADHYLDARQRLAFDRSRLKSLEDWRPRVAVIAARWSIYAPEEAADLMNFLGKIGSRVILLGDPPELPFGERNAIQYLASLGVSARPGHRQYLRSSPGLAAPAANAMIGSLGEKYEFCHPINVYDLFRLDNAWDWVVDGREVLYIDDDHLSENGTRMVRKILLEKLRGEFSRPRPPARATEKPREQGRTDGWKDPSP